MRSHLVFDIPIIFVYLDLADEVGGVASNIFNSMLEFIFLWFLESPPNSWVTDLANVQWHRDM